MIRILVIDDEPINYHLVMQALQPTGYEIEYAENGNSGISKALQIKPDLIITDVMMPDISGYEVTRLLRREDQFANTPILILTAQAGLQDKLKAFEAGADDHLTKPFNAAELSVRVAALLRRGSNSKSRPGSGSRQNSADDRRSQPARRDGQFDACSQSRSWAGFALAAFNHIT